MSSDSDRLLVQQIRQGLAAAWEELIARYEGRLRAYVRRRVRDATTAEDLVQETFVGFLHSLPNFDDKRDLQTWLFTIASHKVTDHIRRTTRRPTLAGAGEADDELMGQTPDDKQRAASSLARTAERQSMEADAVARGLRDMIRGWWAKGEFVRIQVLELLFVKGWANKDVAKLLGVSEQQVANYRFAAVKKLTDGVRAAGLSADVFPELDEGDPASA